MKAVDILWDVDDLRDLTHLPKEVEIPWGMTDLDEISDYLSDVTEFCHRGFRHPKHRDGAASKRRKDHGRTSNVWDTS